MLGRALGSLYFVFGILGGRERRAIPGSVVIRLLRDLGMNEATARAAIMRMRASGRIESVREGREARYRVTPDTARMMNAAGQALEGDMPPWDGTFRGLLYSVPEPHRAYRDTLRRAAATARWGLLRPGLLVTPYADRWADLEPTLREAPPGTELLRVELRIAEADARTAAVDAWELTDVAREYAKVAVRVRSVAARLRRRPTTGRTALRIAERCSSQVFGVLAKRDPYLPAELLPTDWPGPALRAALGEVFEATGPGIVEHVRSIAPDIVPFETSDEPSSDGSGDDGGAAPAGDPAPAG